MIYSQFLDSLPEQQMQGLAEGCQFATVSENGVATQYRYEWLDMRLVLNVLPKSELRNHLDGFVGFLTNAYVSNGKPINSRLIERIKRTQLVIGVVVEPDYNENSRFMRLQDILGAISCNTKSLVFFEGAIIDENGQHLFP